jgi:YidC/Oxa1 family membrane protein insertase
MNIPVASVFTEIPEKIIVFFHDSVGLGWGPSIVALVFLVRLIIFPISLKQIRSMRAMAELQPHIKAIQEKYKNDKQRQQQEMMRFYQENEINPLASCLPLLLQLPVFLSLYYMLRSDSFQQDVQNSPPEGWGFINSLIEPPQGSETVILIILFIVTQLAAGVAMTVRGQGLEGPQRFIVFGLPFLFAPFVASFNAGLSVYWITTNIWTFGQQQVVYKLMGPMKKPTDEELAETTKAPPPPPRARKKKKKGRTR